MALYDATFSRTPAFVSRRSLPRTIVATGALLLCGAAVVFAVVNFAGLMEYSKESAQDASRPRYQALRGAGDSSHRDHHPRRDLRSVRCRGDRGVLDA